MSAVTGMRLLMQAEKAREAQLDAPFRAAFDNIVGQWMLRNIEQMAQEEARRTLHTTIDRMADDASFDIWLACARWRAEVDGKQINRSVAQRLRYRREKVG